VEDVGQQARRRVVELVLLHVFPALCVVVGGIPRTLDRRLSSVRVPLDQIVERQFHSLPLGATRQCSLDVETERKLTEYANATAAPSAALGQ